MRDMVRISDARMSGTSYGTVVLHIAPEAAVGGPLALVRDGDVIVLDVPGRRLEAEVDPAEMGPATTRVGTARRRGDRPWVPQAVCRARRGCRCRSGLRLPPRRQRRASAAPGLLNAVLVTAATGNAATTSRRYVARGRSCGVRGVAHRSRPARTSRCTAGTHGPDRCRRCGANDVGTGEARRRALVYAPSAAPTVVELIAAAVSGPVVEVFTSRWAAPEGPDVLPSVGVPLLLGWARDTHGRSRWHTAREISDAALETLASGSPAQLGAVRPSG